MAFYTEEMTEEAAAEISRRTYPHPYEAYNFKATDDEIDQLMNGLHVAVYDEKGSLCGFVAFGWSAQVVCDESEELYLDETFTDIALGLAPELCGRGLGVGLVKCAVDFAKELFPEDGVRLTVKSDNLRAVKTYQRAGFEAATTFTGGDGEYTVMVFKGDSPAFD